ncbi:hypothetical protein COOONC_24961, partial [Cooperia oncophora]
HSTLSEPTSSSTRLVSIEDTPWPRKHWNGRVKYVPPSIQFHFTSPLEDFQRESDSSNFKKDSEEHFLDILTVTELRWKGTESVDLETQIINSSMLGLKTHKDHLYPRKRQNALAFLACTDCIANLVPGMNESWTLGAYFECLKDFPAVSTIYLQRVTFVIQRIRTTETLTRWNWPEFVLEPFKIHRNREICRCIRNAASVARRRTQARHYLSTDTLSLMRKRQQLKRDMNTNRTRAIHRNLQTAEKDDKKRYSFTSS